MDTIIVNTKNLMSSFLIVCKMQGEQGIQGEFKLEKVSVRNTLKSTLLKYITAFLFLFLFSSLVASAQVGINSHIDKESILIGDYVEFQWSASYNPLQYQVQFPMLPDTFNHFEVIERSKIDTTIDRDLSTFKQTIRITNFDSGKWQLPIFDFEVKPLHGESAFTLHTDSSLFVNVKTVAVDTSKAFMPIKGIRAASMPLKLIILYTIGAILIAALLIFLVWYLIKTMREKNKAPLPTTPQIILLPHEKALQSLGQLEKLELWQQGQEKLYHTQLTDIIRTYLEEQFQIDCLEKTSSEIIAQVKKQKMLNAFRQPLRNLFEVADMVKFAKGQPSAEEHLQCMEIAIQIIQESYKKLKAAADFETSKHAQ